MENDHEVDRLVAHCRETLGDKNLWQTPGGYPDSLALCIIDAIYSTGSHYNSVVNVVERYIERHGRSDGAKDLVASIEGAGGPRQWAVDVVDNLKPAHTQPSAPLKAEVIFQAAQLMGNLGIDTVSGLISAVEASPQNNPVHDGWKALPSQSSGVTYNYLLILAGLPSVKPDRMVLRYLREALGQDAELSTSRAIELITDAAHVIGVSPRTLDHVVWRAASGREPLD